MRHLFHKLVCWYLRRCSGAFHAYPYGNEGRYVVLMTEQEYALWQHTKGQPPRKKQPVVFEFERSSTPADDLKRLLRQLPPGLLGSIKSGLPHIQQPHPGTL